MKKRIITLLFLAYCIFLLWMTVISRHPREAGRVFKWQLLWSYRAWIAGESYGKTESIQNINNVLVFIPFGFLFPKKQWKTVLFAVLFFSILIEIIQFTFALGWCEIDDVICNTLGAMIGFWICKWLKGKIDATGEKTRDL